MSFVLIFCAWHFIFLNLFIHTHAQDLLGAILAGVQNGINLVNNNLEVGQRYYPDYTSPANRDVSFSRPNDVSQSNQNDSGEPNNSNSEQRHSGDSGSNSEEYDRENTNNIEEKKTFLLNKQMVNNNQQNRSPNRQSGPFDGNVKNVKRKPIISNPALLNKQKILSLVKERLGSNSSLTHNKESINLGNVTTIINNGSSTTPTPLELNSTVNRTVIDNLPNLLAINDSSLSKNTLNSTHPVTDKTIKKDNNKNVLKPLTKKKFFFQAKPVKPLSEEVSTLETIYYIDLD